MTPLAANLKHLYQRRGMWLLYVLVALMSLPLFMLVFGGRGRGVHPGAFAFPWLIVSIVGMYCAAHVVGVLNSPVSFCLPGHQKTARRFLVIVGAILSALVAMVFLAYPDLDWPMRGIALASAFCVNLTCYGFGAAMAMTGSSYKSPIVAGLVGWTWLLALVAVYLDLHIPVVNAVVGGNPVFMGTCLILCALVWSRWGNRDMARRVCGNSTLTAFDIWDPEKGRKMAQARWASKSARTSGVTPLSERFFLGRMGACRPLSAGRSVWGGLYATFGGIGMGGKGLIFLVVFFGLYFGYLGAQMSGFLFVFASFLVGMAGLPTVYSTLLVALGRRERFLTGIGAALMGCLVTVSKLGGAVLLTHLLAPFAPALNLKGHVFHFQPLQPWGLWVPLAVVPAVQAVKLIWPKRWFIAIMIFVLAPFPAIAAASAAPNDLLPAWIMPLTMPLAAAILTVSWSLFLAVLRWVCFRRSLVVR